MELLCLTFHHHNPLHGLVRNRKKITKPSILLQSDSHSETGLPELASKNAEHSVKLQINDNFPVYVTYCVSCVFKLFLIYLKFIFN